MRKKTELYSLLLIGTVALALSILVHSKLYQTHLNPKNTKQIDAYMTKVNIITFTTSGTLKNKILATRSEHIPDNDATTFTQPTITLYQTDEPPWHIQALHGRSSQGSNQIDLTGDVKLHQAQSATTTDTAINTQSLTYHPNKDIAYSYVKTSLKRPNSTAEGIGVIANFKTGNTTLLAKSKSTLTPHD